MKIAVAIALLVGTVGISPAVANEPTTSASVVVPVSTSSGSAGITN